MTFSPKSYITGEVEEDPTTMVIHQFFRILAINSFLLIPIVRQAESQQQLNGRLLTNYFLLSLAIELCHNKNENEMDRSESLSWELSNVHRLTLLS